MGSGRRSAPGRAGRGARLRGRSLALRRPAADLADGVVDLLRDAPDELGAVMEGGPYASPACTVQLTLLLRMSWKASWWSLAGFPCSAPARSNPSTPRFL